LEGREHGARTSYSPGKPGCNARPDDALEYKTEDIVIAEALVARSREYRVIWNFILNAKPAEPAIGKVDLDFAAQRALRANRKYIRIIKIGSIDGRPSAE
jgi:hypothetical protein